MIIRTTTITILIFVIMVAVIIIILLVTFGRSLRSTFPFRRRSLTLLLLFNFALKLLINFVTFA
jgi:hypothetical protein